MKNSSETMYKIGRIFSFVLLGIAALLLVIHTILMIVAFANGHTGAGTGYIGNMIGDSIWLALIIVVICLASKAINAMDQNEKEVAPHVTMIVFGALSCDVFYVLGGIFGIIAINQNNQPQQ